MSNVSLVCHTKGLHPFTWGGQTPGSSWSTTINAPSNGKYKDGIYTTVHGIVQGTAGVCTATINIQASNDEMTGMGVTIPVVLTNSSTTVTLPTFGYTMATLQNTFPTGTALVTGTSPGSFFAVPTNWNVYPNAFGQDQKMISLTAGMVVTGPGFAAGTTIASVSATSLTVAAAPTGLATSPGVYWINFANPYWGKTALATLTLSGTSFDNDIATIVGSYRYLRANVTNVTGTNATAYCFMGN